MNLSQRTTGKVLSTGGVTTGGGTTTGGGVTVGITSPASVVTVVVLLLDSSSSLLVPPNDVPMDVPKGAVLNALPDSEEEEVPSTVLPEPDDDTNVNGFDGVVTTVAGVDVDETGAVGVVDVVVVGDATTKAVDDVLSKLDAGAVEVLEGAVFTAT